MSGKPRNGTASVWVRIQYGLLLGLCKAVAALPDGFLYGGFLRVIYFVLYRVVGYRKSVVRRNLAGAFPEKDEAERRRIEREFFRHLAEIFVDTMVVTSIPEQEMERRVIFLDMDRHAERTRGKSWICAMSHYGSWEYCTSFAAQDSGHETLAVYKPLHSLAFDMFYKRNRSRLGATPVPMHDVLRHVIESRSTGRKLAVGMLSDQTPLRGVDNYWFDFLNRPALFYNGMDKIARKFGMPVYFMQVRKLGVRRYEVWFEQIYDGEEPVAEHEITMRYKNALEDMIRRRPELWMWSHKRWKHLPLGEEGEAYYALHPEQRGKD